MTWQGMAEIDRYNAGSINISIGNPGANDITVANFEPVSYTVVQPDEGVSVPTKPLSVPTEVAEALYKALQRIFGSSSAEEINEVLRESLEKERARVDFMLSQTPPPPFMPTHLDLPESERPA